MNIIETKYTFLVRGKIVKSCVPDKRSDMLLKRFKRRISKITTLIIILSNLVTMYTNKTYLKLES